MSRPIAGPQAWELGDLPLHRLITFGRRVKKEACCKTVRVAVLGTAATQHYCQALAAVLKLRGWWPEIYEAEYDTIEQEVLDPGSGLYRHAPEFVILFTATQALLQPFAASSDKGSFVESVVHKLRGCWEEIKSRSQATIVQHNLAIPLNRPYGNSTAVQADTFVGVVTRINHRIHELAPTEGITVIDTDFQASYYGKRHWFDERLWCQAKQALSPSFVPALVKAVSDAVLAEFGVGVKCVVVDLDNTLWGGILAEDGPELIELGHTDIGLAYSRFQLALAELKARGVLLAICSKNIETNVLDVIDGHPDMILRRQDFACCMASYDDKVSNILAIRDKLKLALDSFVFLDDTPFERELVRQALPEVQVPELSADPADFVSDLARWNLFDARLATAEDFSRLAYYQTDEARATIRAKYAGLDEFIADLRMKADILDFTEFTRPRVLQLVQRSNQFNLTTIRYGEGDLRRLAASCEVFPFCIRLSDRLGDNGIIAVVILRQQRQDALVDSWIMSCRVLGRRVEDLTLQTIIDRARDWGCTRIVGRYVPTAKNGIVKDLYPRLGFVEAGTDGEAVLFALNVAEYESKSMPFEVRRQELVGCS